jgi:LysM repeat protein
MRTSLYCLRGFKWNRLVVAFLFSLFSLTALASIQQPAWASPPENRTPDLDHVSQSGNSTGTSQGSTTGNPSLGPTPENLTPDPHVYVYTVRSRDTWIGIAQRFGIAYSDLREVNAALWFRRGVVIHPGDQMTIPSIAAVQVGPALQYTVVAGDSWYQIAETFGVSYRDLQSDNSGLWVRRGVYIQPGDQMTIFNVQTLPSSTTDSATSETSVPFSATTLPTTEVGIPVPVHQLPEGATLYVVRPGDSWFTIAAAHGVEFEKLRATNQNLWRVRGQALRVADEMVIPPHGTPPPPIDIP